MKKIKILQVGISSNLGGIEKFLIDIYRNLDHNKFDMKFLVFDNGNKPCFYDEIKNDVIFITPRNKNYLKFIKELTSIYINGDFDYIHFNLMEFSCFERIIMAQKYSNAKLILHSHIADNRLYSMKTRILNAIGKRKILKKEKYIKLACSIDAGNDMFKDFKNKEFEVINNGINIEQFIYDEAKRKKIRRQLMVNDKMTIIGHVGRFVEQKNHTFLIEIFYEYTKLNANSKLLLIGKGPLKKIIIEKSKKLGIEDKIIFLEDVYNVNEYMSAMDIFLFPSLFEGLGIVLIEAQVNGLNCYATDTLPSEIEITKKLKKISLNNTPIDWARKLENSTDRNLEKSIRVLEFDIKSTTKKLMDIYSKEK